MTMAVVEPFPSSYGMARRRFRDAGTRLGWRTSAYAIGHTGPEGEDLTIDVAIGWPQAARAALVVSSGLHGVEGFCGSAVQTAAMTHLADTLARADVRVVFVHALNPYGFAWLRRVNEDNVDLNRNFLADGEPFAGAPATYGLLDPLLNPRHPPRAWDRYPPGAVPLLLRHGLGALTQAVAEGQFAFPRGLFFGGTGPSRTREILHAHAPGWLDGCETILHLDLHTGLGRWARWVALADEPVSAEWRVRLHDGPFHGSLIDGAVNEAVYRARGTLTGWLGRRLAPADYLGLCIDFGTRHPLRILAGLREENQAHQWSTPDAACTLRAKHRLLGLFCPPSVAWRGRVMQDGLMLVTAGVRALASR